MSYLFVNMVDLFQLSTATISMTTVEALKDVSLRTGGTVVKGKYNEKILILISR